MIFEKQLKVKNNVERNSHCDITDRVTVVVKKAPSKMIILLVFISSNWRYQVWILIIPKNSFDFRLPSAKAEILMY